MLKNSIKIRGGLILTVLIIVVFAGCFGGGGGEDDGFDAWFTDINPSPGSVVETSIVEITGEASCPGCPRLTEWMLDCPTLDCPESTNITITWSNTTTGESGATDQRVVRSCLTFFGWCACECVHRWAASVPLALGENEIVITATEPSMGVDKLSMKLTRLLEPPRNIVAVVDYYQITLNWDSVPDATSYNLYWSTDKTIDPDTVNKATDVSSPYAVWGTPNKPHYFWLTAVNAEHESNMSERVMAVPGWRTETVSEIDRLDMNTSIAVDSLGNPHIHYSTSYWDGVYYYHNYYTTRQAGNWVSESVGVPSVRNADIALGANNTVHISNIESAGLTHLVYTLNAWVSEIVDPEAYDNATLALDSQDKVHLAYRDRDFASSYNLKYVSNKSGNWVSTTIDRIGSFGPPEGYLQSGRWISLDVEADGAAHIAYEGSLTEPGLRYATNQGGTWSITTVDPGNNQQLSLALDVNGKAHIIYTDYLGQLRYAQNTSGAWLVEQVGNDVKSYFPSIALDTAGNAHIIYFNTLHDEVRYATNTAGLWHTIPLDTVGDVNIAIGVRTDIAVDTQGLVYISYSHDNTSLKYTTNR
ncbi:MAG: fibronectin type III domain-containing protein [Gammaproteobacteria bacterium]|nr:fibronectin type III domain-containing protein [Gammaproteobacteria bacterium]